MDLLIYYCYAYGPILPNASADSYDSTVEDTIEIRAGFRGFIVGLTIAAFGCIVLAFIFYYCCSYSIPYVQY